MHCVFTTTLRALSHVDLQDDNQANFVKYFKEIWRRYKNACKKPSPDSNLPTLERNHVQIRYIVYNALT